MLSKPGDLEKTQELFDFLQGKIPEGYVLAEDAIPHLTPDQSWAVVWYLGDLFWQVSDNIERCDVCGDLFDSCTGGGYMDEGPPYHFCEACLHHKPAEADD